VPKIRGQRGVPACSAKISQFLFSMGKEKRRRPELLGVVNLALFRVSLRKKRKPLFGVSIILRCPLGSPVTRLAHTRTTTLVHDKHLHFGCDVHAPGLLSQRRKPSSRPCCNKGESFFVENKGRTSLPVRLMCLIVRRICPLSRGKFLLQDGEVKK